MVILRIYFGEDMSLRRRGAQEIFGNSALDWERAETITKHG